MLLALAPTDPHHMTLTLRAVSLNDHALSQPITADFDAAGGSIGRDDRNTLALPDPERYISRQQAEISAEGNAYRIKNVGSANPIIVRGRALAHGESAALAHLDQVRIGGYALEVFQELKPDEDAKTITGGRAAAGARTPAAPPAPPAPPAPFPRSGRGRGNAGSSAAAQGGAAHGFGDLGAPLSSSNPFADLLGDATPARPVLRPSGRPGSASAAATGSGAAVDPFAGLQPPPAGVAAASAAWAAPAVAPPQARLPDDFDAFAARVVPAAAAAPRSSPAPFGSGGVFDDLIPGSTPVSIDDLIDQRGNERDPLAGFLDAALQGNRAADAAAGGGPGPSTDPLAMFAPLGRSAQAEAAAVATAADNVPALHAAFAAPLIARRAPPPGEPLPGAAAATASPATDGAAGHLVARHAPAAQADTQALWQAFCQGAGIADEPPQSLTPEQMRVLGSVLNAAVAGTLQLMKVRATTRHELRAEVTVIQARNNNPLKFSPDAGAALEQLLKPPLRGFLSGPAAMTDAMHDLVGHAIGTMAGTRAALEGVLDRFIPGQLEAKLAGNTVLDNLLPMNRKAKLWELYLRHFESIRNEAQDDFHTLFGRAFLAAYEQQLERFQHEAPGPV